VFASRYPAGFLRSYVRIKTATDPVYNAVYEHLRDSKLPVLDVGCGIGILAFYLRERGFAPPIAGIDHDSRKVEVARTVADGDRSLSFEVGDARTPFDFRGNIVLLDVLHYFSDADQKTILGNAVSAGGMVLIREGIRDGSFRYRFTYAQELLARAGGWLKAERLNFSTADRIEQSFNGEFRLEVQPMSGRMPFNNYLFAFKRSSAGTTKA
jgi:2-polyprenyl-3-methyl-5-hydroxy-6-metoxy-1,4-benzoquinol methylase